MYEGACGQDAALVNAFRWPGIPCERAALRLSAAEFVESVYWKKFGRLFAEWWTSAMAAQCVGAFISTLNTFLRLV